MKIEEKSNLPADFPFNQFRGGWLGQLGIGRPRFACRRIDFFLPVTLGANSLSSKVLRIRSWNSKEPPLFFPHGWWHMVTLHRCLSPALTARTHKDAHVVPEAAATLAGTQEVFGHLHPTDPPDPLWDGYYFPIMILTTTATTRRRRRRPQP